MKTFAGGRNWNAPFVPLADNSRCETAKGGFDFYQILSSAAKLQKSRRPTSEQGKMLSDDKTDSIVNFSPIHFNGKPQSRKIQSDIFSKKYSLIDVVRGLPKKFPALW